MEYYRRFPAAILHLRVRSIVLLTRPPLGLAAPYDLHALATPPAFNLSQDQTLQLFFVDPLRSCDPRGDLQKKDLPDLTPRTCSLWGRRTGPVTPCSALACSAWRAPGRLIPRHFSLTILIQRPPGAVTADARECQLAGAVTLRRADIVRFWPPPRRGRRATLPEPHILAEIPTVHLSMMVSGFGINPFPNRSPCLGCPKRQGAV